MTLKRLLPILYMLLLFLLTHTASAGKDTGEAQLTAMLQKAATDTARIKALQNLAIYYANKPGEDSADLDKAFRYAIEAVNSSRLLRQIYYEGISNRIMSQVLRESGKSKEGKIYAKVSVKLLSGTEHWKEYAGSLIEESNYYDIRSATTLHKKIDLYRQAVDLLSRDQYALDYADALKFLGDLYSVQERCDKSLPLLLQALNIYRRNRKEDIQDVYDLLGYVYTRLGKLKEALSYGLMSARFAEQKGDSTMNLCTVYNRLGIIYNNLDDHRSAADYFLRAAAVARRWRSILDEVSISCNLAHEYLRMSDYRKAAVMYTTCLNRCPEGNDELKMCIYTGLVESNTRLENLILAGRYRDSIVVLMKDDFHPIHLKNARVAAINVYFATHDFAAALPLIRANEEAAVRLHNLIELSQSQLYYFKVDSATGKYRSAIDHYQKYKMLQDSLDSRNRAKEIGELQIRYDTEKKEQNIEILKKQGMLQKNELQKESVIKRSVIAGSSLLVIVMLVVYRNYRLKKGSHKMLAYQQVVLNEKNQTLEVLVSEKDRLLRDKEWLLKEIHHRVKNNLQIVISLLNTQSAHLDSEVALAAIQESQHRMRSISLIHQKLYQSDDIAVIDMSEYIMELIGYLKESFVTAHKLEFDLQVEPVALDVAHAVPLGLVLNEAVTNSIKYAFDNCDSAVITISLDEDYQGNCILMISDNGCGLPADFDNECTTSLGLNLMKGLARQLGGELSIESRNGLIITLTFNRRAFAFAKGYFESQEA